MSKVQVYPGEENDSKLKELHGAQPVSSPSSRAGTHSRSRLEQLEKTKTKTCCGKNIFRKKFSPSQHNSLHATIASDSNVPTTKLQRIRRRIALFFDQDLFQIVLTILIIANAVLIGVDTDARDYIYHSSPTASQALSFLDTFFTLIFTLEIGLKLFAFGCKEFWSDRWNIYDFVIVAISLIEAASELAGVIIAANSDNPEQFYRNSGVFSILRVLRVLRVLRTFRLFSMFEDLSTLIQALRNIFQPCSWVIVMFMMVLYVYSVMVTVLFGQDPNVANFHDFELWFGTVFRSMYTLFQIMTLESWSMGIVRPVWEEYWYAPIVFISYIFCTTICILNLFAAVFVDGMDKAQKELKDKKRKKIATFVENAASQLREAFEKLDIDKDGFLTQEELIQGVSSDSEIKDLFLKILGGHDYIRTVLFLENDNADVDQKQQQEAAVETLSKAFEILDIDDSGRILCEDFLDVALHMDEPAKKEDIYHTRLAVSHLLSGVHQQTEQVKEAALGLGAGSAQSSREKKLVAATIKAVMQAIPDTVDFSIVKVLEGMESKDASTVSHRKNISKLTEAIYREIASK